MIQQQAKGEVARSTGPCRDLIRDIDVGQTVNAILQLVDFWTGRATYDDDQEWLENVGCQVGELCELIGYGDADHVGKVPKPAAPLKQLARVAE